MSYHVLTVYTDKYSENLYKCWWMWGKNNQGILNIDLSKKFEQDLSKEFDDQIDDAVNEGENTPASLDEEDRTKMIVAELNAIHYLLEVKQLAGGHQSGNMMKINVGFGAIKKLQHGSCKIRTLLKSGIFLRCRFSEAQIIVNRKNDFISPKAEKHVEDIGIRDVLASVISDKEGRSYLLSWHALQRMMQRWNMNVETEAWRKLMLMFKDSKTERYIDLTKKEDDGAIRYYNPEQNVLYIISNGTIVTIVHNTKKENLKKMATEVAIKEY